MMMNSWEELPDDCWEAILASLDRHNLRSLSLVSKRFHHLSNRARSTLQVPYGSPFKPSHFYARFPNLTSLTILYRPRHLGALVRKLAASALPLRSLCIAHQLAFPRPAMRLLGRSALRRTLTSLACTYFYRLTQDDLLVIADSFSYLRHLTLSSSRRTNSISDQTVQLVSAKLTSLLSFNMWCSPHMTDRAFSYLASNCSLLNDLTATFFSNHSHVYLHHFGTFSSLSTLRLDSVNISEIGLVQLAGASLKLCKLTLYRPRCIGNVTGAAICSFLKSCTHLAELWMIGFRFPSDMATLDFAASIPNISLLNVRDGKNLPENILLDLFYSCPVLEKLGILNIFVAGDVQGSIELPVRHRMRELHMTGWGLTDETLMLVASVCPKLESLYADHCSGITERGMEAITAGCRNIKHLIVNDCEKVGCSGYLCQRKRKHC